MMKLFASSHPQVADKASFLYHIDDDTVDEVLIDRYARFKLGDPACRRQFLIELASLVRDRLTTFVSDIDDWVLVTPATTDLAQEFAITLAQSDGSHQQIPVLAVGPDPHPDSDYTNCSADQREQIVDSFYDLDADLDGKKLLVIDDFVNTGTALNALAKRLVDCGVASVNIFCFVLIRGSFSDPKYEAMLVTDAISKLAFDDVARILTDPGHSITSATMLKYLAKRGESELRILANTMPAGKRDVLRRNAAKYYRKHPLPNVLKRTFFDHP